jgi:N-acyl-D-aspartate/D-glutamate deacylase
MLDILIKNALLADGSGNEIYNSDIGIAGGKITLIQPTIEEKAEKVIDCQKKWVVSPGFIDTHSHGDFGIFACPGAKTKLFQGVTTDLCGNCGISAVPVNPDYFDILKGYVSEYIMPSEWKQLDQFSKYLDLIKELPLGINMGFLVGHGTIRIAAMGMDNRKPTESEMDTMKSLLREAMESGAYGMSSGLIYPPGVFADKDELIALCQVVKEYEGVYATHMRNESFGILEGVKESLEIGKVSGVKLLISHHKAVGMENFGKSVETLAMIDEAVKEGMNIRLDQYPYTACSTSLSAMIPPEFHDGGVAKLVERLKDPVEREKIKAGIFDETDDSWDNMYREAGFENILVVSGDHTPELVGKTVSESAKIIGMEPIDTLFEILIKNQASVQCVEFAMGEEDIERIMTYPLTMVGSDSMLAIDQGMFHPRAIGTYPRVLGRYIREKKVIPLHESIKRMTSMPAEFFGISGKGLISESYDADIVIFDPKTIIDQSDYLDPHKPNIGIHYVIVNGEIAASDNVYQDSASGTVMYSEKERG